MKTNNILYYYKSFYSIKLLTQTLKMAFDSLTEKKILALIFITQILFLFVLAPNWIKISYTIFVIVQIFLLYFRLYLLKNQTY